MERNWDLIREILRILAEKDQIYYGKPLYDIDFIEELKNKKYHKNVIKYHLKIMIDEGFIDGDNISSLDLITVRDFKDGLYKKLCSEEPNTEHYCIKEMTYQGQDLWEAIKEKSVWEKITQYATKNKIPLTLDTIKMIIPMLLKTMFS